MVSAVRGGADPWRAGVGLGPRRYRDTDLGSAIRVGLIAWSLVSIGFIGMAIWLKAITDAAADHVGRRIVHSIGPAKLIDNGKEDYTTEAASASGHRGNNGGHQRVSVARWDFQPSNGSNGNGHH